MFQVIMTLAVVSAMSTIVLVGIKGAIELYAPIKAQKEKSARENQ
jgi:cytochrome c-type biogenesis protein CcmE